MPPFDPSTARLEFDPSTAMPIKARDKTPPRRVATAALDREARDEFGPFWGSPLMAPFSRAWTDPRRRGDLGASARGFARDMDATMSGTLGDAAGQAWRGAGAGLAAAPGAIATALSNPGEVVRGATYGGWENERNAAIDQYIAESGGDASGADEAAQRGNAGMMGSALTLAAPALLAGAGRPVQGSRGIAGYLGQTARGARTGASYGAGFGFLTTPGDLEARTEGAVEGGGVGGAIGGLTPSAVNLVSGGAGLAAMGGRAVARRVGPVADAVLRRLPQIAPAANSGTGAFGAQVFSGAFGRGNQPAPPPPEPPQLQTPRRVAAMFERARMTPEMVETAAAAARARPQGQVLADLAGDTGVRTVRPVVQSPGETGAAADVIHRERVAATPSIITNALRKGLNVGESRDAAMNRLETSYRQLSANAYQPLWDRPVTPRQEALYEQRIAPLFDPARTPEEPRSIMTWAMDKAQRQFQLDRMEGLVRGSIDDNMPRLLHYLKMQLGDRAGFERSTLAGPSGQRLGSLRRLYRRFSDLLDPTGEPDNAIIPGYRAITRDAGDYFRGVEALEEGAAFMRMNPEEVQRRMGQLRASQDAFAIQHVRIGLADEVRHATRGKVIGSNTAANALNDPDIQRSIAAVFDSPEQAADFIDTVNTQNVLVRQSGQWGSGSQTFANAAYGADGALQAIGEAAGPASHGVGHVVAHGAREFLNAVTDNAIERGNNRFGEDAFRRIDAPKAEAFTNEVARVLRERRAAREANARAAAAGSRVAGAAGRRDPQGFNEP